MAAGRAKKDRKDKREEGEEEGGGEKERADRLFHYAWLIRTPDITHRPHENYGPPAGRKVLLPSPTRRYLSR